jgi:hypothetical protein
MPDAGCGRVPADVHDFSDSPRYCPRREARTRTRYGRLGHPPNEIPHGSDADSEGLNEHDQPDHSWVMLIRVSVDGPLQDPPP